MTSRRSLHRVGTQAATVLALTVTGSAALYCLRPSQSYQNYASKTAASPANVAPLPRNTPRSEQLALLRRQAADPSAVYDLVVIGGGAIGTGIALDAVTRGLKVAMFERDDFGSGTSSKSTKLVHGGVRYLEKAVKELDYEQYCLVRSALKERRHFLNIAPHLSQALPLLLPIRQWWEAPYLWIGMKLYDLLAGAEGFQSSYFLPRAKVLQAFPTLDASQLVGGLVYYDGQHDDARTNVALAMTAVNYGATVVNHAEVTGLEKDANGEVCGVYVRDRISTSTEFLVRARGVINATGPFTDEIHRLDNLTTDGIVKPSCGVHIVLPAWVAPKDLGLISSSSDNRVIFLLPWQGKVIAGTTDRECAIDYNPLPDEEDVNWILKEVNGILSPDVSLQRSDVLATWSGIRPLVCDPLAKSTEAITRSHLLSVSRSGLLTCVGGKWTTFREIAEEAVSTATMLFHLIPQPPSSSTHDVGGVPVSNACTVDGSCRTRNIQLIGAHGYSPTLSTSLRDAFDLDTNVAGHLARSYGDRAWEVASLASPVSAPTHRIAGDAYPYLDGEVRYAVRSEYAQTAVDVLARRTRLAFLDVQAAVSALPAVIGIMAEELEWGETRIRSELTEVQTALFDLTVLEQK
ncbi:FAD dependent oxidoreductase-domain-containing protein [Aspergillus pseudoustus]|uniref:Glycerol-3-phosphate dehydrogenase n=1 Tax=Aspergillus pseudoustus TaxID=1810923 RepID=A0ABR4K0M2_9EURO